MKLKFLFIPVLAVLLSSCHFTYYNKPEDLAVPIVKALQDQDADDAFCLIPGRDDIEEVVNSNSGLFGATYYNKYSKDYRYEALKGKLTADFEIARSISEREKLDWSNVLIGGVNAEDVNDDAASYSRVKVNLRFYGGDYLMQYNAVKTRNHGWYLANDVNFSKASAGK